MRFSKYPEYKDSGVEWLGEVPAHWEMNRLRYIATLNPSKSEVRGKPSETPVTFLPMDAVGESGSLDLTEERALGEVVDGYTYLREGDVAYAKITPCFENGKAALIRGLSTGIAFGTTELTVLRPLPKKAAPDYLFRIISSEPFRTLGEASMYGAGGQKRVPDGFARDFLIAWPPLSEQRTITAFLDHETARIDALIEEQERLIELLKEKRQAVISHAVTKGLDPDVPMKDSGVDWLGEVPAHWDVLSMGLIKKRIQTGPFGSQLHSHEYVEGGIPVINPANIIDGEICPDSSCTVTQETVDRLAHHKLHEGEVVLGRRGEMGRCATVSSEESGWLCGTGSLRIALNSRMLPHYVSAYLRTPLVRAQLQLESVGSTMNNLNPEIISRQKIPVPPFQEQAQIINWVNTKNARLDLLLAEASQGIRLLRERRSALISAAVTGKIDVRDWQPPAGEEVSAENHQTEAV